MKAELKFNLDDRDDKMAHMRCVKSSDMAIAIWNIKGKVGKMDDYFESMGDISEEEKISHFKETIFEMLSDINLDELIE